MKKLSWQSPVELFELREEPAPHKEGDFLFESHAESGPLADMVRLVQAQPETDRGRFVIKVDGRVMYRQEIEHLAGRPDFPTSDRSRGP